MCHGGSERLSLRLIWPTAKHRPIQHDGSGQSPLCTFGTIYCRFQSLLQAGDLACSLCFAVKAAGGDFSSRTSIREARCTCPPLHVMTTFGGSCSRSNAFPPAGSRNPCIFTSLGLDTKFALSGPQMPLLTGWVEVDDQTLTTLRRMFRPHRSALVNGQGSLHDRTWGRSTYTVGLLASAPAELCMVMAGV